MQKQFLFIAKLVLVIGLDGHKVFTYRNTQWDLGSPCRAGHTRKFFILQHCLAHRYLSALGPAQQMYSTQPSLWQTGPQNPHNTSWGSEAPPVGNSPLSSLNKLSAKRYLEALHYKRRGLHLAEVTWPIKLI